MADRTRDRSRGALVGLACGDAMGNDTSMALCLAESIVDRGELDLADHLRRYRSWRGHGFPSGPEVHQDAAADASLVRVAPVAIAWHRDLAHAAERSGEATRSTQTAPPSVDACRFLGAVLAGLIGGRPWEEVSAPSFWAWGDLHPEVAAIAAGSFHQKERSEVRWSGSCVRSLEAALWTVVGADDVSDAVLRAVNLGDHADSTAVVAGQIAGARWGMEAIPASWLRKLVRRNRIVSLADALFDLHAGPRAADARWLHDEPAHAWWVEPGRVLAGEYPWASRDDVTKLDLLVDAGIRTFVDLTSPADPLEPYDSMLASRAATRGLDLRHQRFAIPDFGTIDLDGYASIVEFIAAEVEQGRPVYVHCWGGIGRTGTVVGCLLARDGMECDQVITAIAALREGTRKAQRRSPESDEQVEVIRAWLARGSR